MKVQIINGPNLNLLGKREPEIYGNQSFEEYFLHLKTKFNSVELSFFQSNIEGEIIDKIHEVGFDFDAIIINAGGYSHTSIAIADALKSIPALKVEVHISNIFNREAYRHQSFVGSACMGSISGFGLLGYDLAIQASIEKSF